MRERKGGNVASSGLPCKDLVAAQRLIGFVLSFFAYAVAHQLA